MIDEGLSYEDRLQNYQLAYQLLKRKLRTSYVSQLIKSISLPEIRDIHRSIHQGESPSSGLLPAIEAIPQVRESMLYISLYASLYRSASPVDIRAEMDVSAIIFAWDFFAKPSLTIFVSADPTVRCVPPISAKPGSPRKR